MARIVVIGAGVGGLATAARLAATGHEVTVFERADTVGGKLGRYVARHPGGQLPLRHRAEPAHPAAGLPRPVRGDRREARRVPGPGAAGPDRAARLPRRRTRPWTRAPTRTSSPPGSAPPSATGPPPTGGGCGDGPRGSGTASHRDILRRTVDSPRDLAALAWRLRRPGRHRARPHPARAGPQPPVRPAAADAAGPVRHLHRRRPAPGPGRAGRRPLRRAGLRRLVSARRAGHPRRRAARRAAWTSA